MAMATKKLTCITEAYLDDFIIVTPLVSDQCQIDLNALKRVCSQLGVLLAAHTQMYKQEGPTAVVILVCLECYVSQLGQLKSCFRFGHG